MLITRVAMGFCPFVPTEETIFNNLINLEKSLKGYHLIVFPLAHSINTLGVSETNRLIKKIPKEGKRRIFVCQHIKVNQLQFEKSDLVFTPHKTSKDDFLSIPHYPVNFDPKLMKEKRKYLFSFLGSTSTHWIRKQLVKKYDSCFDSKKHWGLENKDNSFKENYIELLGNSLFSLCPRGTGPSSIRLFEAIAMGSFPVIISDNYILPMEDKIHWDRISIKVKENDLEDLSSKLNPDNMDKKYLKQVFEDYLKPEKMHMSVLNEIQ